MADTVTRDEFKQLEGRVQVLESETAGEKRVTRYILEQARLNGDDLAAIKTRLDRMETDVGQLKSNVNSLMELRRELPRLIADTMREVLREPRG